jgi:hypothetical protein
MKISQILIRFGDQYSSDLNEKYMMDFDLIIEDMLSRFEQSEKKMLKNELDFLLHKNDDKALYALFLNIQDQLMADSPHIARHFFEKVLQHLTFNESQ